MTRDSGSSSAIATPWALSSHINVWNSSGAFVRRNDSKNNASKTKQLNTVATDDELDSYAQRVLEEYASSASMSSDELITVDESLGAYVTNRLREWTKDSNAKSSSSMSSYDVCAMPDYQALCELLQEQCSIVSSAMARQAMETIAKAVFEKRIPSTLSSATAIQSLTESLSRHGLHIDSSPLSDDVVQASDVTQELEDDCEKEEDEDGQQQQHQQPVGNLVSPLAVDSLIPLDLLEDPLETQQTPTSSNWKQQNRDNRLQQSQQHGEQYVASLGPQHSDEDAFPPLSAVPAITANASTFSTRLLPKSKPPSSKSSIGVAKGEKGNMAKANKGYKADDLAAALFRHVPRSRQSSIDDTSIATNSSTSGTSPSLQALHYTGSIPGASTSPMTMVPTHSSYVTNALVSSSDKPEHLRQQPVSLVNRYHPDVVEHDQEQLVMLMQHCAELLLCMNAELSTSAALAASDMCQGNVGAAQYLVNAAAAAPPICRHLLNSGCYRADCQFSHDIESHTCIFWLKGRCSRQNDNTNQADANSCRFLHGFHPKLLQDIPPEYLMMQEQTQEQQQIEQETYQTSIQYGDGRYESNHYSEGYNYAVDHGAINIYEDYGSSSWGETSNAPPQAPNSFANIASHGYNSNRSFADSATGNQLSAGISIDVRSLPTAKIPQDLWNPHENRDSAAFHIANPIERYYYVKNSVRSNRDDVIDLHFQSIKTFPVVLDTLLQDGCIGGTGAGTWIVTGTGHHVGTQTHQKGGGALENAVLQYLVDHCSHIFSVYRGRDRNGQGGAILIARNAVR